MLVSYIYAQSQSAILHFYNYNYFAHIVYTNVLADQLIVFSICIYPQDSPIIFEAGSSPRRINVTAGQDFTINCRVTKSYPPNLTITLTTPGSVPTDVTANPSRVFRQNQAGTYTYVCRANSTRATVNLTYQVSVAMSPSRSCLNGNRIMVRMIPFCYFSNTNY